MKGEGPRHERETIIRFDEESNDAVVWTASEITYRRLKKLGYKPTADRERSANFTVPKALVRIASPNRWKLSDTHKAALQRGRIRSQSHSTE